VGYGSEDLKKPQFYRTLPELFSKWIFCMEFGGKNGQKVKNLHNSMNIQYFLFRKNMILKFAKNNAFSSYLILLIKNKLFRAYRKMPQIVKNDNFDPLAKSPFLVKV